MATKKSEEQYKAWIKEVEAELAEDQKANFQALVNSEAGQKLFGGHLREKDYYSRLNELDREKKDFEKERTDMYTWYQSEAPKNQKLLSEKQKLEQEVQRYRQQLVADGFVDDPELARTVADAVRKEDLEAARAEFDRKMQYFDKALPHLLGDVASITFRALKEGLDVNPKDVIQYSITNGVDPNRAYEALTADEREKREAKRLQDELAKAREEGRREALSKFPTPDYHRPAGPSIVDQLRDVNAQPQDSRARVNAAVQEFLATGGEASPAR